MKKGIILSIILIWFLFLLQNNVQNNIYAYATENDIRNNDSNILTANIINKHIDINQSINQKSINEINKTSVRFCNQGIDIAKLTSTLQIQSRPGQMQEICTIFFNNGEKDTNFYISFGEAKKNKNQEIICDDNVENVFTKTIKGNKAESIKVLSYKQKQKPFFIKVPKTATGEIIGCLSYTIDTSYSKNTGDIFGVVVRKTAPISIVITGDVYNFGWRDDITYVYIDNKQAILKIIIAILSIGLLITIFNTITNKKKH